MFDLLLTGGGDDDDNDNDDNYNPDDKPVVRVPAPTPPTQGDEAFEVVVSIHHNAYLTLYFLYYNLLGFFYDFFFFLFSFFLSKFYFPIYISQKSRII